MRLDINTSATIKFTKQLEKMRKFDLPIAVRATLNDAAFDVKTKTMPKAAKEFKQRQPNFFKANSRWEAADGFNISNMRSAVGFYENKLKDKATNYAVKDLEQQEMGGVIKGKSFIAMKKARTGKGLVRANDRIKALRANAISAIKTKGTKKQKFIRSAFAALKTGKLVLGNKWKGSRTLSRIDSISMNLKSRKLEIKRTPLYTYRKGGTITVAGTNFMKRASHESGLKMEMFYVKNAEKRIAKFRASL